MSLWQIGATHYLALIGGALRRSACSASPPGAT